MTTTWCWPPILRVLPRNGFNAFVKKDNKVLTLLQTCEYLPWILASLFAQRHTKTIPVAFQTSEPRLACSHQQLGFQSSEKEKKPRHSNYNQEYQRSRYLCYWIQVKFGFAKDRKRPPLSYELVTYWPNTNKNRWFFAQLLAKWACTLRVIFWKQRLAGTR